MNYRIFSRHCLADRVQGFGAALWAIAFSGSIFSLGFGLFGGGAIAPVRGANPSFCQLSEAEVSAKDNLRNTALKGNANSPADYALLIKKHAEWLRRCRSQTWPQEQAIWLRLYPCDVRPGSIDAVLDRIVNQGYSTVYVEVFADSQVLLPPGDNPTVWDSLVRAPRAEKVDLLAEAIKKGRDRGLKVYAWVFTMNFGYVYAQKPDRQDVLARNGKGEDSTSFVHDQSQAFIDPYNLQAQADYAVLLQAILKRRPDGILFDYVRYPRGTGDYSAVGEVKDLWIHSSASRQVLINRAFNNKGKFLIERYLAQGFISTNDLATADRNFPQELAPLWQGRKPSPNESKLPFNQRYELIKSDIWNLAVAHAAQGVIDFLSQAATMAQQYSVQPGAVFFPDGNQVVGKKGFDSRLQAWDKFPTYLEWHPMAYGLCQDSRCIVKQVQRVTEMAPNGVKVIPAIAGLWGKSSDGRPILEEQMSAVRSAVPRIQAISHFAFSWQQPEFDKERRFCKL